MSHHRYRTVLMTSEHRRHKYVAQVIAEKLDLVGVVTEAKPPSTTARRLSPDATEDERLLDLHFRERDHVETLYFGDPVFPVRGSGLLRVARGKTSSQEVLEWIQGHRPDILLLYGTSIIRDPVLSAFPDRVVNLHLGLSPYYRGSGTNFWPLYNDQPECVGFTVHLAVLKVDAGPILIQGRPKIELDDRIHEIGCKTIATGAIALADAAWRLMSGDIQTVTQTGEGMKFLRRDFNAKSLAHVHRRLDDGMIPSYLQNTVSRKSQFPIVGESAQ